MAVSEADVARLGQVAPHSGIQVTWDSLAGCERPSLAVQQQIGEIASQIQAQARVRELLRLHVTACSTGCQGVHTGEIGLRVDSVPEDGSETTTIDLLFSGHTGLTREVVTALPIAELRQRLVRLLRVYTVEGCAKDTFATWSRGLSDQELRSRLGLSEQTVAAAGATVHTGATQSTR